VTQPILIHGERIAALEARVSGIDEKVDAVVEYTGKTADTVTEIKIMLAEEQGRRKAMGLVAHAASVVLGALAGFWGGRA
jgi:hypothetical protein